MQKLIMRDLFSAAGFTATEVSVGSCDRGEHIAPEAWPAAVPEQPGSAVQRRRDDERQPGAVPGVSATAGTQVERVAVRPLFLSGVHTHPHTEIQRGRQQTVAEMSRVQTENVPRRHLLRVYPRWR